MLPASIIKLSILCTAISITMASTIGTRFQLVFMENIVERPTDQPLEVYVSNVGSTAATVTVSSPNTTCPSSTRTVAANSIVRFDVCWWMRLVAQDYWPVYKTVLVESTQPVSVYGYNKELFSADAFLALPTNQLSTLYFVESYDEFNIATQFAISAVEQTQVHIKLPAAEIPVQVSYKGMKYTNGDSFTISLNPLETFLAQSRGDISGTEIRASKRIAVFAGNVRNKIDSGSRDHLAVQLTGGSRWGTVFPILPVVRTQNFGDGVRVMGRAPNTQFRIQFLDGSVADRTLTNPGDYTDFFAQGPLVISALDSAKPLQVVQVVRSQAGPAISDVADPAMFLIHPSSRWLSGGYISPSLVYTRTNASYDVNYALLTIASGNEGGLRVDGNAVNPTWNRIQGLAFAWVNVGAGVHRFTHVSNARFGVMMYGASDRESYGFELGADLSYSGCEQTLMTRGDGLDNDCDNRIEEEACDGLDNDNDGLVDEDCTQASVEAFGNSYTLMFMENNVDDNPAAESFLEIYMYAIDSTKTVQYTLRNERGVFNGTIPPNQVEIFTNLPTDLRHIGSGIANKAIGITSDNNIVVYAINKQTYSTDGTLCFPNDVVGTEYYTSHYWPGTDLNEFAIAPVTVGQRTTVTVTMPQNRNPTSNQIQSSARFNNQVITAGQSFSFEIEYGQTAQFQAASFDDNLNGARIVSSLPVSVMSGNIRARVMPTTSNSRDHLVHQLSPVSTWGNEFVTIPAPRTMDRGDIFTVTGSVANTVIQIQVLNADRTTDNSKSGTFTLSRAGDYRNFDIGSNQFGYIRASQPVQLFQFVKTTAQFDIDNADPAMMLIPPVEQWSRNYQFATPRTGQRLADGTFKPFDNFVMIAIDNAQRSGLRLDGSPLSANWTLITGTVYSVTTITVLSGRHSLTHTDPAVNYQALMYGRADRESYALPLGLRLQTRQCQVTAQQPGDNVDNDCDEEVDEEICNGLDDDGDNLIDEDCGAGLSSGTSFFLTYMDNIVEYPMDFDLELYVAVVGSEKAQVTVRAPLVSSPLYNIASEILPGKVQAYGFTYRMRNVGQGITGNTIFVRASTDVVVYGINKETFSNDGFLVYPENSLGTSYYTVSWSPATIMTQFAVVATADNTVVQISLPSGRTNISVAANGRTYGSGESFSISLNRYQVYQAQSVGDLTGTKVDTSVRAAVFSGNIRTKIELSGSRDHLVEQMLPTTSYGTEFYVVPFPQRTVGDILRVIARQANTNVLVNGQSIGVIPSAGGFIQYNLPSTSQVVLTASAPVMVVQFLKSQDGASNPEKADPAMFIVPSASNLIQSATFITPVYSGGSSATADYTNFLTVVVQNGQQGNLRFNGAALTQVSWTSIGSSSFVAGTVNVPSGQSNTMTSVSGASFYGRLYGKADRESYAFPVGFRF